MHIIPAAAVKALEAPINLTRRAAESGDAEAQYQLGLRYAKGDGVEEDQWEAVDWLRKAAKQGHKPARDELAKRGKAKEFISRHSKSS